MPVKKATSASSRFPASMKIPQPPMPTAMLASRMMRWCTRMERTVNFTCNITMNIIPTISQRISQFSEAAHGQK